MTPTTRLPYDRYPDPRPGETAQAEAHARWAALVDAGLIGTTAPLSSAQVEQVRRMDALFLSPAAYRRQHLTVYAR